MPNAYGDSTVYLQLLWVRFIDFLPNLLGAVIVLLIGWLAAVIVAAVVRKVLRFTGVDGWVARSGLNERMHMRVNSKYSLVSNLLASIAFWIIFVGSVGIAADMLQLVGVSAFIGSILAFMPNVIVAVLILTVGLVASNLASEAVQTGESAAKLPGGNPRMLGALVRYSIIVFAVMAALTQLHIVPDLIQIAFAGLVFSLALAFGLGGRDHADRWIASMKG
jgi:hypothetical protein